ncbi:MAG: pilus assembly protein [Hyphomicrobiaceae bacterium]
MLLVSRIAKDAARDERGTVAIIFALSLVVLLISIGLAIDTARYYAVSTRVQTVLDGATLAAAKLLADEKKTDSDVQARAMAYFNAAAETLGVKPSDISIPTVKIDRSTFTVELEARIALTSLFGRLAGLSSMATVDRKSKVMYGMSSVELALVLDITGSMGTKGKLADLKFAARDIIDTLFDTAVADDDVRIALAPYSASVNAGSLASAVTIAANVANADTCVLERQGSEAFTDAAPTGSNLLPNVTNLPALPSRYVCPSATVIPLSNRTHRDDLKSAIQRYEAEGATAGHIGTAWGWYLLSPNWTSLLPDESAPKAYDEKDSIKAMVVMTDGEFNTSYTGGSDQTAESYRYFDDLCASAKTEGIMIYTIGFDLNSQTALTHLQSCASSPSHFYDAKTGSDLKKAFRDIGVKLGNLRVAS